jgi:hypothetical protein
MWLLIALACTDPDFERRRLHDAAYDAARSEVTPPPAVRGEPLREWPRVYAGPKGIFLDLAPVHYATGARTPAPSQLRLGAVGDREALNAAFAALPEAYDAMNDYRDAGHELDGLNVVLDASLDAEAATMALYVAGQLGSNLQLVAAVDGRLRGVQDFPRGASCVGVIGVAVTPEGAVIVNQDRAALPGPNGACPTIPAGSQGFDPLGLRSAVRGLIDVCEERWNEAVPEELPVDDVAADADLWRCLFVETWVAPSTPVSELVAAAAATGRFPGVAAYLPVTDTRAIETTSCEAPKALRDLDPESLDRWCGAARVARSTHDLAGTPHFEQVLRKKPRFRYVRRAEPTLLLGGED